MTVNLSFAFTVFFLTLGPVKIIPVFYMITKDAINKFRSKLALESALIATGICLFISFVGQNTLAKWGVSLDALRLAAGLILLLSALKIVTAQSSSSGGQKITAETPLTATRKIAMSALVTPVIITSYGVLAILFYMVSAQGNLALQFQIIGLIIFIMILNYLGMIFANPIMDFVGLPVLKLIGWIFAIMQSALAIDIMLEAFKSLGIITEIN